VASSNGKALESETSGKAAAWKRLNRTKRWDWEPSQGGKGPYNKPRGSQRLSSTSGLRISFWSVASSLPTVATSYPRAQQCGPVECLRSPRNVGAMCIADCPCMKPNMWATACGGLDFVSPVSILLCSGLYGCLTTSPAPAILALLADSEPQSHLTWKAPTITVDGTLASDVAGYKFYYGLASRQYSFLKMLGLRVAYGLVGLVPEQTDYVVGTTYDRTGTESGLSEETTMVVPSRARCRPTLMQEILRRGQPPQFWAVRAVLVRWCRPCPVPPARGSNPVLPNSAPWGWILLARRSLEKLLRMSWALPRRDLATSATILSSSDERVFELKIRGTYQSLRSSHGFQQNPGCSTESKSGADSDRHQ
jgi:hypothetical protein